MSTETTTSAPPIQTRPPQTGALATTGGAPLARYVLEFTAEQEQMIRDTLLNGASESEAKVLIEIARLRGLNPITRQIHFVKRWDKNKGREVWAHQVGIDGLRAIAERTGKYDGQDKQIYEYDAKTGNITLAEVKVYRKDIGRPFVGVAYWAEYAQKTKTGALTSMWQQYPRLMLAKCAEALALRKAFPDDMSGLYTDDEMPPEIEVNEAPAPKPRATRAPKNEPAATPPPTIIETTPSKPEPTQQQAEQPAAAASADAQTRADELLDVARDATDIAAIEAAAKLIARAVEANEITPAQARSLVGELLANAQTNGEVNSAVKEPILAVQKREGNNTGTYALIYADYKARQSAIPK